MFNLFTSYYFDKSPERQKELDECLIRNTELDEITKLYVVTEEGVDSKLLYHKKIINIVIKSRPTYNTFFELIRMFCGSDDWNIIANSDIYFDATLLEVLKRKSNKPLCFALTRWEVEKDKIHFLNRPDSQDSWIFKGKPPRIDGDFTLGTCGCDNAIAYRFHAAGYDVINPSKTIKTYHLHESNVRHYNINNKVKQPYKILNPTT